MESAAERRTNRPNFASIFALLNITAGTGCVLLGLVQSALFRSSTFLVDYTGDVQAMRAALANAVLLFLGGTAVATLMPGIGVWRMKRWGLMLAVGELIAAAVLLVILNLVVVDTYPNTELVYNVVGSLIGAGILGWALHWFIKNRRLFQTGL